MANSSNSYNVQRILERYTETLGGLRSVAALSSLSIEGSQVQEWDELSIFDAQEAPKLDSLSFECG